MYWLAVTPLPLLWSRPETSGKQAANLVELEHSKLDLLVLVLDLLRLGVGLLLALLGTTSKAGQHIKGRLVSDARRRKKAVVCQLTSGENDALLAACKACRCSAPGFRVQLSQMRQVGGVK